MPLGDALYTITMSASRPVTKTTTDWTEDTSGSGWGVTTDTLVKFGDMIYLTAVELHTNINVEAGVHYLEMYLNNTDEASYVWGTQILKDSDSSTAERNYYQFFQPIRANEVYFGIRSGKPYTYGGSLVTMAAQENVITVFQTPRNFA